MFAVRRTVLTVFVCLFALPLSSDMLKGTLKFQTATPQSMFGPIPAFLPGEWRTSFSKSWDAKTPGYDGYYGSFWQQDTYLFGTVEWGGGIRGAAKGTIGLGASFAVNDSGSVNVTYTVKPTIQYPQPNTFAAGDTISVETWWERPATEYELRTASPQFAASLDGIFGLGADAGARYCVFSCGTFTMVPRFDIGTGSDGPVSFSLLTMDKNGVGTPFGPLDLTEDPVSILHVPTVDTLDTEPDGADGSLASTSTDHFLQVGVDLAKIMTKAAKKISGREFPSLSWESPDGSPVHVKYALLKLMAVSNLKAKQSFRFEPAPKLHVTFAQPLEHWIVTGGAEGTHETSASADFDVGSTLKVKYPSTDKQPTKADPLFALDNDFHSQTDVIFSETFDPTVGQGVIEVPSTQVFPELCTPEVKIAGVVIIPEVCTPEWSIGPYSWSKTIWSESYPLTTNTYNIFTANWTLGGFDPLPLDSFQLDPENPIVLIDQITGATRNLGAGRRQVAYAIDIGNGGDVDLDLVHLTSDLAQAFGDAYKFQVDQIIGCSFPANVGFNGRTDLELFAGDDNTLHNPIDPPATGTTARVILIVSVWPKPDPQPYVSTSSVSSVSHYVRTPVNKSDGSSVLLGPGIIKTADDLVLFGEKWVKLEAIGDTFGHIGSNEFIEIKYGQSGIVAGDLRARRSMKVQGSISADYVFSGGRVDLVGTGSLTLTGNIKSPTNVPALSRSAPLFVPFAPYSGNVWVAAAETLTIQPGYYGDVTVNPGATLNVEAGTYHFLNVFILDGGHVVVNGNATVTVRNTLSLGAGAQFFANGSSRGAIVQVSGPNEVIIGSGALFRGTISAPRSNISFLELSQLQGSAYGNSITLRPGARAAYHIDCDPVVDPNCSGSPHCQ